MYAQVLAGGLVIGAAYGLVAVSFSIIYHTARFFHLAHAATYTVAAYLTLVFVATLSLPPFLGIALAIAMTSLSGCLMYVIVYRPLERRATTPAVLLLASLGILIVMQGGVSLIFSDAIQTISTANAPPGLEVFGARLTQTQISTLFAGVCLTLTLWLWLIRSRLGMILRALANDPELSRIVGVNTDEATLIAFGIGSAMVAAAAVLSAYDTDLTPMMGFRAVLIGIVAAIVGGIGSVPGGFLGGIFIGLVQQFTVLLLPGQWQDTVVFAILILMLVSRPRGLLAHFSAS